MLWSLGIERLSLMILTYLVQVTKVDLSPSLWVSIILISVDMYPFFVGFFFVTSNNAKITHLPPLFPKITMHLIFIYMLSFEIIWSNNHDLTYTFKYMALSFIPIMITMFVFYAFLYLLLYLCVCLCFWLMIGVIVAIFSNNSSKYPIKKVEKCTFPMLSVITWGEKVTHSFNWLINPILNKSSCQRAGSK